MRTVAVTVGGMTCGSCEESIDRALGLLSGVERVSSDHRSGMVEVVVDGSVGEDDLRRSIEDAGYDVEALSST